MFEITDEMKQAYQALQDTRKTQTPISEAVHAYKTRILQESEFWSDCHDGNGFIPAFRITEPDKAHLMSDDYGAQYFELCQAEALKLGLLNDKYLCPGAWADAVIWKAESDFLESMSSVHGLTSRTICALDDSERKRLSDCFSKLVTFRLGFLRLLEFCKKYHFPIGIACISALKRSTKPHL